MPPNGTQPTRRVCFRALRAGVLVLTGVALAAVPLACGGSADGSDAGPTTSTRARRSETTKTGSFGFETGTTRGLTDQANARVTGDASKTGSFGFETDAAGSDAYGRWKAGRTDRAYWSFRAWVRIIAWTPNESVDLFTLRNREVTNNFDFFVGATDRAFQWDLYRENASRAVGVVDLGRWYLIEARGSFAATTSTAEVWIDGVPQASIASPGQPPSAVKELVLGSIGTAKTNRVQFDDVRIEVADAPLDRFGPPVTQP